MDSWYLRWDSWSNAVLLTNPRKKVQLKLNLGFKGVDVHVGSLSTYESTKEGITFAYARSNFNAAKAR